MDVENVAVTATSATLAHDDLRAIEPQSPEQHQAHESAFDPLPSETHFVLTGRKRIVGTVIAAIIVAAVALAMKSWTPVITVALAGVLLRLFMPSIVRQREKDAEWIERRKRPSPRD